MGFLSLTLLGLFWAGKVDEIELWLWLIGILIALNGIFLYRDYHRRNYILCLNEDGIRVDKKNRLAIPWSQMKSCYFKLSGYFLGGWDCAGIKFLSANICVYQIYLVIERKNGDVVEVALNAFRFNLCKMAEYIDRLSGKRLFDRQKTRWKLWGRIAFFICVIVFALFYCKD